MRKKKDFEKIYKKIENFMLPKGMECGKKIATLLKKKGNITIPLYRSAMIITPQKHGNVLIEFYSDPHYTGEEITKKNLKKYKDKNSLSIQGQRSNVDIWFNVEWKGKSFKISDVIFCDELEKIAEKVNKKWNKLVNNHNLT